MALAENGQLINHPYTLDGTPVFQGFPKLPRLHRDVVITEKLDGTNAQIFIDGNVVRAGSKNRWLATGKDEKNQSLDNHGFAAWVEANADALREALGPGRHFGEWYGQGIARAYGLTEKRFALFNTSRWYDPRHRERHPLLPDEYFGEAQPVPDFLTVVPVLWRGNARELNAAVDELTEMLRDYGSIAVPGFMRPEGLVVFHEASGGLYKVTLEHDELPKEVAAARQRAEAERGAMARSRAEGRKAA